MRLSKLALVLSLGLVPAGLAHAAPPACKAAGEGKAPEVFINPSTPVRRGPGLNYPVAAFLERGRCAPFSELSVDRGWVLVEVDGRPGWVPASRLSKESQGRLAELVPAAGPVGSGQSRTSAVLRRQAMLLEGPTEKAPPRRLVPEGTAVLPLAASADGRWVQVRDGRGEVGWVLAADVEGPALAELPRIGPEPEPEVPARTRDVLTFGRALDGFREKDLHVSGSVHGLALGTFAGLDSDGVRGERRYRLAAFAPGTGFDVYATDIGPLAARVGYQVGFLAGIEAGGPAGTGLSGLVQDATVRAGLPIARGAWLFTPEVGYGLAWLELDSAIPGQARVTFLSSQTHALLAGGRVQRLLSPELLVEADLALAGGFTLEGPADLGAAGLAVGARAGVAATYLVLDAVGVVARYGLSYRRTGFSGAAGLDPSITEAALDDLVHGLSLGVWFAIGG